MSLSQHAQPVPKILALSLVGAVCFAQTLAPLSVLAQSRSSRDVPHTNWLNKPSEKASERASVSKSRKVESAPDVSSESKSSSVESAPDVSSENKSRSVENAPGVSSERKSRSVENASEVSTESKSESITETSPAEQSAEHAPERVSSVPSQTAAKATKEADLLKGSVTRSSSKSPLLYDKIQELPKGTTINLVSLVNINSEVNAKGDEIWVRVGNDVHGPSEVAVPGGWYMHGVVTESAGRRRGGLDGYVTVKFDKLVSPDRQLEVPFDAHVTSKKSMPKAVAKHLLIDSGHIGLGALGGSIMAVQFGGIGTAIATHGISVGVGAGIGATVGLIGAAKRKGSVSSILPGEEMKLVVAQPVCLPGFDAGLIPSAKPVAHLKNFEVLINKVEFSKDHWGDRNASLLTLNLTVNNKTSSEYKFSNLAVVSDREQVYYPDGLLNGGGTFVKKKVKPNSSETAVVAFSVAGKRHKYWLVLLDRANQHELNRIPIN